MMDGIDKTIENEDELQLDEMESPQSEVTSLTKELAATKEKLTSLQRDFDKSEDRWKQAEQTNTDLEKRIESMNKELNIFRESTKKDTVDVASQTVPSSDRVIQSQGAVPENLPKNPGPSGWVGNENSEGPSQSIADSVKAAAEAAVNRTGFVLDRTSGMYYDCNSGYYYDQVNQLYYDPTTGIYYYFDDTTDSYQFHSQVDLQTSALAKPERYGKGRGVGRKNDRRKEKTPESRDDILSSAFSQLALEPKNETYNWDYDTPTPHYTPTHPKARTTPRIRIIIPSRLKTPVLKVNYAPCVRMIVTKSDSLKPGSLYIVTCSGGTIGREGSNHSVVIQSVKVSKRHAKLVYDSNERHYTIVDLGSQNGTLLNGKAISEQRVVSAPHRLTHRDYLTIGGTTLRVHIHNGDETCEECEPGQVQALMALQQQSESHGTAVTVGGSRQDKEQQRRKELRQLKKKYSLSKEGYTQGGDPATMNPSYVDRAGVRQRTVGSDNPYQADDAPASVDRAISSTNLGHKLLSKMGWSEGQSLGKGEQGIKEPVQAVIHSRNAGLGASSARSIEQASYARRKNERFDKARERFYKGTEPTTSKGTTWVHGGTKTESSSPMVQLPLAATNKHEMHRSRDEDVVEICDDMPTGVASDLGRGKSGGGSRPMKLSDRAGISGEQELLTEIFTERQKWDESGDASTRTEQKSDNHISEIMEGGGSADTSCSSGGDPLSLRDGEIDDAAANEITDGLEQAESSCISEKPVLADSGPDRTEPVKSIKLKWNKAGIKEKQRPINLPAFGESESGDEMESGENGQVTPRSQPESRTDKSGKDKPSRWSQSSKSSTK